MGTTEARRPPRSAVPSQWDLAASGPPEDYVKVLPYGCTVIEIISTGVFGTF